MPVLTRVNFGGWLASVDNPASADSTYLAAGLFGWPSGPLSRLTQVHRSGLKLLLPLLSNLGRLWLDAHRPPHGFVKVHSEQWHDLFKWLLFASGHGSIEAQDAGKATVNGFRPGYPINVL